MTDLKNIENIPIISKNRIVLAGFFFAVSTISKASLFGIEFSGGPTLAAIGALFLLWPALKLAIQGGGSTEFLGIKLQLNNLERKTESELALRVESLRADLEELRNKITIIQPSAYSESTVPVTLDTKPFFEAINEYRKHSHVDQWRVRIEADKSLASGLGRLPISFLSDELEKSRDMETAMAVAVCLGLPYPGDSDLQAAILLLSLLESKFERVRYRAAFSVGIRANRSDTSREALKKLRDGVESALRTEYSEAVLQPLRQANIALAHSSPAE